MAFYQLDAGRRDGRARRARPAVRQAPHPHGRIDRRAQRPEGHRAGAGHERVPAAADRHRPPAGPRARHAITCSGSFTEEQRKLIDPAIERATSALVTWIDKGINAAMNQFNVAEDESESERSDSGDSRVSDVTCDAIN